MNRRVVIAVAAGAAVGAAGIGAFGPLARAAAVERGRAVGATVGIEHAWPALDGVRLRGVSLALDGVPGVRVWIEELRVGWRSRRPTEAHGIRVVAVGDAAEIAEQLGAWRARLPRSESHASGGGVSVPITDVALDWRRTTGEKDDAAHVVIEGISRDAGGWWRMRHANGRARLGTLDVEVSRASFDALHEAGEWRVRRLTSEELTIEHRERSSSASSDSGASAVPAPAAEPDGDSGKAHRRVDVMRAARGRLLIMAALLDAHLTEDAHIDLAGTRIRFALGGQTLVLGPSRFDLVREPGLLVGRLTPTSASPTGGATPLTLRVGVPVGEAARVAQEPLRAELRGGPIALAQLGLKEGDFGLRQVARGSISSDVRIELTPDSESLKVEGSGEGRDLALQHERLAAEPLEHLDVGWSGALEARLDGTAIAVRDAAVRLGKATLRLEGAFQHRRPPRADVPLLKNASLDLRFEVPRTDCQAIFDSLPRAMVPKLLGTKLSGALAAKGHARFDTANLGKHFDVNWDGELGCRVTDLPAGLRVEQYRRPFDKVVYGPEGEERTLPFGPGTPNWVPSEAISKFMEVGVLVCEDGRFPRHHGFDKDALVSSIRDNLAAGAFRRGASTVSMQLAKNLYLSRDKVLARKVQEAILTVYLEQELTKDEILELYFNLIEYGPMVYGIGPAAQHYFGTTPANLSLAQSMFLASILQNPKQQHFEPDGSLGAARADYVKRLVTLALKRHRVSEAEAAAALEETLEFGRSSTHAEPEDTNAPAEPTMGLPADAR